MSSDFLQTVSQRVLLGDGAMGTQLQLAGLLPGACGEIWNLDQPDKVQAIQERYANAGSDCLITNTFGASRLNLDRHGQLGSTRQINIAGARLARQAFAGKKGFVLGDVGPCGGIMEPLGDVEPQAVYDTFAEQIEALLEGGVDAIIIETQVYLEELQQAMLAAKKAGASCIIASMAFDVGVNDDIRTMMGVTPEAAARFAVDNGADVIALNCGKDMDIIHAARVVTRYRQTTDRPVMAQPNAGSPVMQEGRIIYKQTPEELAAGLHGLLHSGAQIVGACCGSTPEHIRAMRPIVDSANA